MRNDGVVYFVLSVLLLTFVQFSQAHAQGRTAVAVGAVELSPSAQGVAIPGFADTLRSEIQIALEGTGLFSVPGANSTEINAMLSELARTGRTAPRSVAAQYVYAVRVETLTLSDDMRVAPQMNTHDLVTTRGAIALQISVISPSTGSIVRVPIDATYRPAPAMRDAMVTRGSHAVNRASLSRNSTDAQAFQALARAAAARLAGRILENNNAVQIIDIADGRVFINRGEDAGYAVGDTLSVRTRGRELRDPITGERLGDTGGDVGRIRLTEVRARLSVGVIEEGADQISTGALVRRPRTDGS